MRWLFPVLLAMTAGCRSAHEGLVRQRIVQKQLEQTVVPLSLSELDARLMALPRDRGDRACPELCLQSAQTVGEGTREYCLARRDLTSCMLARAEGPGTRLSAPRGRVPAPPVVELLWRLIDEPGFSAAIARIDEDVPVIAAEEEAAFRPLATFTVGARSGVVVSFDTAAFTFGGHAAARVWLNYFILAGGGVEAESVLVNGRNFFNLAPQVRLELALWREENTRFFNLPELSFIMAAQPLFAFGPTRVEIGGRAVLGVSLIHLGNFWTPFFFEVGFQALRIGEANVSGLRLALGFGL